MSDAVDGAIVIARDRGAVLNTMRGLFRRWRQVKLQHEELDSKFVVYATKENSAQELLTARAMEEVLGISSLIDDKHFVAAIFGSHFYLAITDKEPLIERVSAATNPRELEAMFRATVDEIQLAHRLIDKNQSLLGVSEISFVDEGSRPAKSEPEEVVSEDASARGRLPPRLAPVTVQRFKR